MSQFAKLFDVDGIGQILVMQDTNDDGNPAVKVFFKPQDFGVCCVALGFTDDDEGWEKCDRSFEKMDAEMAAGLVRAQLDLLPRAQQ